MPKEPSLFKKWVSETKEGDKYYGPYVVGLQKFWDDPVTTYKRSIAKKERLIENYKRLILKHEKSIRYLNSYIEANEE